MGRRVVVAIVVVLTTLLVYLAANLVLVWRASTMDQARPAQAIVVLGAAQYAGNPSPDLAARLGQALHLWKDRHLARYIVVTGGREDGDPNTEAGASATWLAQRGVPQPDILREVSARNTWDELESSAEFLKKRGLRHVLLVSDPYHDERIRLMASELGLVPYVSPTHTSPIQGSAVAPYFFKETMEVSLGRITGFRLIGHFSSKKPGSS